MQHMSCMLPVAATAHKGQLTGIAENPITQGHLANNNCWQQQLLSSVAPQLLRHNYTGTSILLM